MKKYPYIRLFMLFLFLQLQLNAQINDTLKIERKIRFGVSFCQTWTSILGSNLPHSYFLKPSLGGGLEFDYFFHKNLGIGAGITYQQRGAGIYTQDVNKDLGNADSTHRHRLRENCIDFGLYFNIRSNTGLSKGNKWIGSLGIIPSYIFKTGSIFHSEEDGFHEEIDWTSDFSKIDLAMSVALGLEINAAEAAKLRVLLICSYGFVNPYLNKLIYNNASGNNFMIGIKASAMF